MYLAPGGTGKIGPVSSGRRRRHLRGQKRNRRLSSGRLQLSIGWGARVRSVITRRLVALSSAAVCVIILADSRVFVQSLLPPAKRSLSRCLWLSASTDDTTTPLLCVTSQNNWLLTQSLVYIVSAAASCGSSKLVETKQTARHTFTPRTPSS